MTQEQLDMANEIAARISEIQRKIDKNNEFIDRIKKSEEIDKEWSEAIKIRIAEEWYYTPTATVARDALLTMMETQKKDFELEIMALKQEMEGV